MKFIHTSDLHLGKRLNEFSLIEDQRYILKRILDIVLAEKADGLIIAGDIYDRQVPSAESVQLLDWFLTELAGYKVPVFAVSGNHDSAERIAFGSRLMNGRGIYLSPVYQGKTEKIVLQDSFGPVNLYLLPFIRPSVVRHALEEENLEILSWQDAAEAAVSRMEINPEERNLLVAHQFVTGASRCESEEFMVGGIDRVDGSVFSVFDYVALGHIHSPQHIGRETVRYCGTPLKYSFSEAEQKKSVTVVELQEKGMVRLRTIPLKPLHDLRKIRGTYLEVTVRSFYEGSNTDDYLQITLTDEEDVPDGMQRLRVIYPNLMRLEYDNRRTRESRSVEQVQEVEKRSGMELFEEFYELQNNQPMSEQQKKFARDLFREIQEKE
ncbi:MAG: exonuclease SbcCD subunit D [Lachnospiraceae bacterium]|nr:exonuclease SbcCD subunit D [Lachnospiraceae bacterium]